MLQVLWDQVWTLRFLAEGIIPLILWIGVYYLVYVFLHKLDSKGRIDELWLHIWKNLSWLFYSIALYQPVDQLFPNISETLRQFGKVFTSPLLGKESAPSLLALLSLIPIFYFSIRLASASIKLLNLYFERSRKVAKRLHQNNIRALLTLGHYILVLLFFLFGINLVGINISSLGVLLGALGLGIGFGLQNITSNFVSGITLLVSGNIQQGNFIRAKGTFGTVERIGLMSTIVLTTDYQHLIIPNQHLLNEVIENASYNDNRAVQLHMPLAVAHESDLDQVERLLRKILLRNPYRLDKPQNVQNVQDAQNIQEAQETPKAHTHTEPSDFSSAPTAQLNALPSNQPPQSSAELGGTTETAHATDAEPPEPKKNFDAERIIEKLGEAIAPDSDIVGQRSSEKTAKWPKRRAEQQLNRQSGKQATKQNKTNKNSTLPNNSSQNWFEELNDVWLKGFSTSSIDFEVRMMIESIDVYRPATHWFYMEVWRIFKEEGITIPFAQMDVRLHDATNKQQKPVSGFGT